MSAARALRGGCNCGRNRYIIKCPDPSIAQLQRPQVLFNDRLSHLPSFGGSPLSAYLRVPLDNFFSATIPFNPDETHSLISRVYPSSAHEQRRFCGYCGTPLSYWSEQPRSEADYIQLTLGSLFPEDLADLEDLGLLPGSDSSDTEGAVDNSKAEQQQDTPMTEQDAEEMAVTKRRRETAGGVSWFDTLMEGSRLGGRMRMAKGRRTNRSGSVRVEWEVVEWSDDGDDEAAAAEAEAARNGKRKLADRESGSAMEDVRRHG
ncbi:hypothetical protein QBC39DRAFT_368501 [Podospora conica]|nr:hypothetical protein QBC39DRAFT_368501 [Schizothecium conicum]